MMFYCDKCGECCRNLYMSPVYKDLHNGDGVCKFLWGNICSIYAERPLFCRIDECYDIFFADKMRREEYYQENIRICNILKNKIK